jgi:molecular chaperone DnaK
MSRSTIDYGIDLGTTNSAIAYMSNVVPEIIKNNEDHDVTPSAVFIGKNGISQVGVRAKAKILSAPYDGYTEFKRLMVPKTRCHLGLRVFPKNLRICLRRF